MALGAGRGRVLRLFVGLGMALLVAAGIVLGLVAAFAGAHWIAALLYGMETGNLVAFTAAALALAAVALGATWLPARRAAAMSPPPQVPPRIGSSITVPSPAVGGGLAWLTLYASATSPWMTNTSSEISTSWKSSELFQWNGTDFVLHSLNVERGRARTRSPIRGPSVSGSGCR